MRVGNDLVGGGIFEALNGHIYGNPPNPTLVLSHGFGTDQTSWHYLIPSLAFFFKVVVFDLAFSPNVQPGFYDPNKYSDFSGYAHDLLRILDERRVDRAIFMGHSMSSMIGCLAAIQKPYLFKHLVLLGAKKNLCKKYLNEEGYEGGFSRSEIDRIFFQIKHNYSSWAPNFAVEAVHVNDTRASSEFGRSLLRMNPKITLGVAKAVFLSDFRRILPRVRVPTTVIESEVDVIVPAFVARYLQKNIGGKPSLNILPVEGHFPQLTAHALLLSVLRKVLALG
ncbi:hypothetical protein V2J09_015898 [Rumex salicifolius]